MSNRRRGLRFESLESRRMMAGNVTATKIGGDLVIVGDELGNSVRVYQQGASTYEVVGRITELAADTLVNGQDTSSAGVSFNGITGSIRMDTHGGLDRIWIGQSNSIGISGALVINTGSGNDQVYLALNSPLVTGTEILVDLGDGDDFLYEQRIIAGTTLDISAGGGNDSLSLSSTFTHRDLAIRGGAGFDVISMQLPVVRNAMWIDGGSEGDRILVSIATVSNDAAILGGSGADFIHVGSLLSDANVLVHCGSDYGVLDIANNTIKGSLVIVAEGQSQITVTQCDIRRLELATSQLADQIELKSSVMQELFASLGWGDDYLAVHSSQVGRRGSFYGNRGTDTLSLSGSGFASIDWFAFEYVG
jgi:hypothetical protein